MPDARGSRPSPGRAGRAEAATWGGCVRARQAPAPWILRLLQSRRSPARPWDLGGTHMVPCTIVLNGMKLPEPP